MMNALRALLSGIIDYAGLFPPAGLPMEPAIRNYARYRTEPEAWMLGRFVCPAERLGELSSYIEELFATREPLSISVLGRVVKDFGEKMPLLQKDHEDIHEICKRHRDLVKLDVIERRIASRPDAKEALKVIARYEHQVPHFPCPPVPNIFEEIEVTGDWRKGWTRPIHLMGQVMSATRELLVRRGRSTRLTGEGTLGFKLRCGGLTAAAFPASEQIAFALVACRDAGIPFKATAGLHHPIRKYRDEVNTKMHGFLNVFGAGVLARACKLSEKQVLAIIEDEDPKSFVFDDTSFRWKEHRATVDQITAARQLVTSFGSCSFDEPREDLRALGLL